MSKRLISALVFAVIFIPSAAPAQSLLGILGGGDSSGGGLLDSVGNAAGGLLASVTGATSGGPVGLDVGGSGGLVSVGIGGSEPLASVSVLGPSGIADIDVNLGDVGAGVTVGGPDLIDVDIRLPRGADGGDGGNGGNGGGGVVETMAIKATMAVMAAMSSSIGAVEAAAVAVSVSAAPRRPAPIPMPISWSHSSSKADPQPGVRPVTSNLCRFASAARSAIRSVPGWPPILDIIRSWDLSPGTSVSSLCRPARSTRRAMCSASSSRARRWWSTCSDPASSQTRNRPPRPRGGRLSHGSALAQGRSASTM